MKRKIIFIMAFYIILSILIQKNDKIVGYSRINESVPMPIVNSTRKPQLCATPIPKRDLQYSKYLSATFKISVSNGSGSGSLVYYDSVKNEAYIASCGHLWDGSRSSEELKSNPVKCSVTTWYQNEKKLITPKTYPATVLFWSNARGYDCSLLKFTPDWKPNYFPIAPLSYPFKKGLILNSCGCDAGGEVALYEVQFREFNGNDLITINNSPRPGRSGGGLLTSDGFYVATCWGTSNVDGSGIGYFTPLQSIYKIYSQNNYGWILKVSNNMARKLPIRDMNNKQGKYSPDYIPLPDNFLQL
jgi:hypothetical protein